MEIRSQAKIYHPRNPRELPLRQLLNAHFAEFESCYDRRFARDYGLYRPVVPPVVYNYLERGDLHEGRRSLAMLAYLLAFAVRTVTMNICSRSHAVVVGSGVSLWSLTCPSCHSKKMIQFAHHLHPSDHFPP